MAALASTQVIISIEDYLNGRVPEPDVEYIDGVLKEKPLVQKVHGRLQVIIGSWFEAHADEWDQIASVEVRTRVSPSRVRLPDLIIEQVGPGPGPATVVDPPTIVIELVSPSEEFTELFEKLLDYEQMGVRNVWVIDPQLRRGWVCQAGSLHSTERFTVSDTPIYLDLKETLARYYRAR